jgi:hypothetical protein
MYHILNFYTIIFFNFIVEKINSKMVKSGMVMLTGRDKANVADAGVVMGWMLQPTAGVVVGKMERES